MKILDVSVNWYKGYMNAPEFLVKVDKIPDLKFSKNENLYFGESEGYCQYHYNGDGYGSGGYATELDMVDGSKEIIKGPWSSRASVANSVGFTPCSEVSIYTEDKGRIRGNLTVPRLLECAQKAGVYLMMEVHTSRSSNYVDKNQGSKCSQTYYLVTSAWPELVAKYRHYEFNFCPSLEPHALVKEC